MEQPVVVESGGLVMEILAAQGARVASLSYRERELLVGPSVNPTNWGATLWTSPQADWGWPPVAAIDSAPYEMSREGVDAVFWSAPARIHRADEDPSGERLVRVEKRVRPGPELGTIDAEYRLHNVGGGPFELAAWEISRVGPGGLTFFATGEMELTPIAPHGALATEKEAGMTWFDHQRYTPGESQKYHADSSGGFLAHATGGLLLMKLFVQEPKERLAPGEGQVELFANEDGQYVEVEVQSAYQNVDPGGHLRFVVRTVLAELPEVNVGVGSRELRDQAQAIARRLSVSDSI